MHIQSRNHTKALWLYMNTLQYFKMQLKYVTDLKIKEAIKLKLIELDRSAMGHSITMFSN